MEAVDRFGFLGPPAPAAAGPCEIQPSAGTRYSLPVAGGIFSLFAGSSGGGGDDIGKGTRQTDGHKPNTTVLPVLESIGHCFHLAGKRT